MNNSEIFDYWCNKGASIEATAKHFGIATYTVETAINRCLGEIL